MKKHPKEAASIFYEKLRSRQTPLRIGAPICSDLIDIRKISSLSLLHLIATLLALFLVRVIILGHRLLGRLDCCVEQLLRDFLVPALSRSSFMRDPRHLQLEFLVLRVFMRHVDDPCRFLDRIGQAEITAWGGKVEFF